MGRIFEALERAESGTEKGNDTRQQGMPAYSGTQDLVVLASAGSPVAEQFRYLRSRVTKPFQGRVCRSILVSGASKSDGKTFVSCNLAATIAQAMDEYVLLVDGDLRNPCVHHVFELDSAEQGLSNHLRDDVPLDRLLQKTFVNKLSILPAGNATENPAELISSKKMKQFISEVTERYPDRFVIFDSPPVELAPEASVIAGEVQGVLMVVRMGVTSRELVQSSLDKFPHENFMGLVFNGDNKKKSAWKSGRKGQSAYGQGYGYGYGYGNAYTSKAKAQD